MSIETREDAEKKPELTEVIQLANDAFTTHGTRISEMNRMSDIVNRRYQPFADPPDPSRFKPIIPGTGGAKVHRIASQIVSDRPIVRYPPRNKTNQAQEVADRLEKWGSAFLQRIASENIQPPLETAAKHAMMGMWCLEGPFFHFDRWPVPPTKGGKTRAQYERERHEHQVRQAERFAFQVEAVDPTHVVFDETSPQNPEWVVKRYQMNKRKFQSMWPQTFNNPKNKNDYQNVEVTIYWSCNWRMVIGDGDLVSYKVEATGDMERGAIENVYGYTPFQFGFGPWSWLGGKPEDMSRGMLFFIEDELMEEARIRSIKSWQAQLYGMTPLVSDDPDKTITELAAGLGAVLSAKGPDIGKTAPRPMELPEPPRWLDRYEQDLKSIQADNTFSPAVEGFREEGMTSGTMSGLHMGEARQLFRPITTRMGRQASALLNRAASIMEHLVEEPVSIWADQPSGREIVTINPDEWKGAYHFNVDLEPVDPTRDDRRGMLGLNYYTQQLLDPWTTLEDFLKVENADEVIQRIMKWKVMQSPEMMQIYAKVAAEEIGIDDVLAALEEGAPENPLDAAPGPDAGNSGDFAAVDGSGIPQAGIPAEQAEMSAPTRGEPLQAQGRIGARVTEPLNDALSGFRS
jgi:hypothetical protein